MLNKIFVNNFRSLDHFYLNIIPGLNVLVGPNGAGKTSIIKWFEFLSLLSTVSLREAIGKVGGANHVFRRKEGKYSETMSFSFEGSTYIASEYPYMSRNEKNRFIKYIYDGEISVIKNQIFFSRQNTKVWIGTSPPKVDRNSIPNIDIQWRYDVLEDQIHCVTEMKTPKFIKKESIEAYYFENKEFLANILSNKQNLEYLIIPNKFFPIDYLHAIKEDMSYKKAFNINPSSVRSSIDISLQPGVEYDGAGLVPTIYDIKTRTINAGSNRYFVRHDNRPDDLSTYLKVLSYFRLSDPSIVTIGATIDNFRNEFNLEVEYESASGNYTVPVFLLSDGTVKWLAIVTALVTESNSLFIEEPENFLHPKLQENIVEIFREEVISSPNPRFAFITTHSETLLNHLRPEEIIVTKMIDAKTVSERVENPKELSDIIAGSGFGLGYFYVSGGL